MIILLLTLFGLSIVFVGMTINNYIVFERRLAHDMTVLASILGNNSRAALTFNDSGAATEILAALRVKQHISRAILHDAQGQWFAGYERSRDTTDSQPIFAESETNVFRKGYFAVGHDITLDQRRIGHIYLETDLEEWDKLLRNSAIVFVLIALLTIGLTLALAMLVQRIITGPINHLVETAREIYRRKDYGIRATKTTGDELGVLVDGFNEMLDEIQRRDADLRDAQTHLEQRVVERTAQLDAANKELEAFSYSVSHDLRAPLRSIDGFSQALLEDYPDRLDEQGRQYLMRVRANTQLMAGLIDDLLKLSRVTRAEIRRETVDLSALAESILEELKCAEPQRLVDVAIPPGLCAEGDQKLLGIALTNILSNAWKFTGRQPSARIELGAIDAGGEHTFYVRDNGVGFDMAYADKLFGVFQRLHAQSEFPGTGVGLATVQRIINRHGGRVWAESAIGNGATFYFTLPSNRKS